MNRFSVSTLLLVFFAQTGFATANEPLDAVNTFFTAMSQNDAVLAATVVLEDGFIDGYVEENDGLRLIHVSMRGFLDGMAARTDALLERIWDVQVVQHERLAVVWTPYDFFLNHEFHHCGVNSFNLIRTDDGWKITSITYSMETATCADSPLGPPVFADDVTDNAGNDQ